MFGNLTSSYGSAIYQHVRQHAVWLPGSDIRIGDYGIVKNGCFKRIASVSKFIGVFEPELRESTHPRWQFISDGVSSQRLAAEGSSIGAMLIRFGGKHSVFLKAKEAITQEIDDLERLGRSLNAAPGWKREWKVVTGITSALKFALIVSSSDNSNVRIKASAEILDQFDIGSVSASGEFEVEGETAFQLVGQSGPILVNLHQLTWFGGKNRTFGSGGAQLPNMGARLVPPPALNDDPDELDAPEEARLPGA